VVANSTLTRSVSRVLLPQLDALAVPLEPTIELRLKFLFPLDDWPTLSADSTDVPSTELRRLALEVNVNEWLLSTWCGGATRGEASDCAAAANDLLVLFRGDDAMLSVSDLLRFRLVAELEEEAADWWVATGAGEMLVTFANVQVTTLTRINNMIHTTTEWNV
jgi:hypothetical protein